MPTTSREALELARQFRNLANELGQYRFANWARLTPTQKRDLEDEEWSLFNAALEMTTKAVGLKLEESATTVTSISRSVAKAQTSIKKLRNVKKIIAVASAAVRLSAAIISKDPGAVAKNVKGVLEATTI